jgi:hypothetical protein
MILVEQKSERDPNLMLIRQSDHAFLGGFFAREWGNELFTKPQPNGPFCLAVEEHDNGWVEWEVQPALDPKTKLPYSFMSIPTATHIAIYQKGIERIVKVDHYAALLASMHAAGLYDRARATMPGYSAKYVKSEETNVVNEFIQQLRLQQLRLKMDLRANEGMNPFIEEPLLKANLARLEALDRLSLHFCLHPEHDVTIEAVPVNEQGDEVDLDLHSEGSGVVAITPYPFRREPLSFSIMTRRVPKRIYSSDSDFQKTIAGAQYFPQKFTMRARHSGAFSRVAGS